MSKTKTKKPALPGPVAPPKASGVRKCKGGWLETYIKLTEGIASPVEYHLWSGISAIAATLGRNVSIEFGPFSLYPNCYIVLTGPSALKKTSATKMAIGLYRKAVGKGEYIVEGTITPAKLKKSLAKRFEDTGQAKVMIHAGEFKVFGNAPGTNGGAEFIPLMTTLWDSPDFFDASTNQDGTLSINNVFVNVLGASVPEWLMDVGGKDFIDGGFGSRILFINKHDSPRCYPTPYKVPGYDQLYDDLVHDLRMVSMIRGSYVKTPEANKLYEEWYFYNNRDRSLSDARMGSWVKRKGDYALKLAAILSANENSQLVIPGRIMQAAMNLMDGLEAGILSLFTNVGFNDFEVQNNDILNKVKTAKDQRLSELKIASILSTRYRQGQIMESLQALVDAGWLELQPGRGSRKSTNWYQYINKHDTESGDPGDPDNLPTTRLGKDALITTNVKETLQ